jgi:hypothetical protein
MRVEAAVLVTSILLAGCAAGRVGGDGESRSPTHVGGDGESRSPTHVEVGASFPELTRASRALREAERQGAGADRLAAMHLALARDQLARGRRRLSIGDLEGARWLFLRAEADADVAALVVREAGLRDAARRTLDEVSVLAGSRE